MKKPETREYDRGWKKLLGSVLATPGPAVELAFLSSVLLFVLAIAVSSHRLSGGARMLPLVISAVTVPLLGLIAARRIADATDLGPPFGEAESGASDPSAPSGSALRQRERVVEVLLWTGFVLVATIVAGMELSLLAFLIVYYRYRLGRRWGRTLLLSFGIWLFVVLVFSVALSVPFPQGYVYEHLF